MNIEKTFQGFNVSDVTSMDTLREIVLLGRKEDNMHPLSMLIQIFISTLSCTVPTDSDIWLIDSGASRHMTRYREHLTYLVEKESRLHVVLGDNARYTVKGV
jgi:hypothetical protein